MLVAEDNEINQQVAREILQGAGLTVTVVNNGREAVDAAGKNQYDAILMDIQMPVMDGYTASREIRNLKSEMRNIPIIAMTAHAMAGDEEKSLEAGMNGHVTKPIDPDALFSALAKWVRPGGRDAPSIPVPETEPFADELPGISVESGLDRVGGNRQLFTRLLSQFRAGHEDAAEKIRAALGEDDPETAARLAHTTKGVSGNLGAEGLYYASAALEKAIKEANRDTLEERIAAFASQLAVVMEGIRVFGKRVAGEGETKMPAGEAAVDMVEVKALLKELVQLLESDLIEAMNCLDALEGHLLHSPVREEFKRLKRHVEGFDTEAALKTLAEIAKALDISL